MSVGEVNMDAVYVPSEDVVARKIEGVLILVPLAAGMGDMEDELYTFNDTGEAIWARLDGRSSLAEVAAALAEVYDAPPDEIAGDVAGLVRELAGRGMLVETRGRSGAG
jgi:hypothetical protein